MYSGEHDPGKGYTATYRVPENGAFWSITVYGDDGHMKSENAILNSSNAKLNADGTFTVFFGSKEILRRRSQPPRRHARLELPLAGLSAGAERPRRELRPAGGEAGEVERGAPCRERAALAVPRRRVTGRHAGSRSVATYELEFYEDENGDVPVLRWLREELTPAKRRALGHAMNEVLQLLGVGVCATKFGKQLGEGLFEFRLGRDLREIAPVGETDSGKIRLQVFCHAHGKRLILLVGGYDKREHPSPRRQNAEITLARARLRDWRRRQAPGRVDT